MSLDTVVVDIGAGVKTGAGFAMGNDPDGPSKAVAAVPVDMQNSTSKWYTQGKNNL
jgi:hypothetical protein